jgi:hypothetical protein
VKRLFQSPIFWRLAIVALIFLVADLAAVPPVLGSGPTVAVTAFQNTAGAPASTVEALGSALYASVDQSGKFSAVGGGPLHVQPAVDGSVLGPAISAASRAGANEVVIAELLSASGGDTVYRLTAYRVAPLAYIRSEVFSQTSLSNQSLTSGFVTNLNTLHAPREAVGTIYSLTNGVQVDMGSVEGFKMGQQFNVMRNGQKMAQAQIVGIDADSARVDITNASAGYHPQVGDKLVGLQPLPAVNPPSGHGPDVGLTFFGLLAATGAALLAIGHHGQAAPINSSPTPIISGIGGFSMTCGTQTGQGTASQSYTFVFSQPVNTTSINFAGTSQVYYQETISGTPLPPAPVTSLDGTQTFSSSNTILTITATNISNFGQTISFFFTSGVLDTLGAQLTPASCVYTESTHRRPAAVRHVPAGPHLPSKPPKPTT